MAFTFLNVGKYEARKSPLELVDAYLMAFANANVDTRLICHWFNIFDNNFLNNISQVLSKHFGLRVQRNLSGSSLVATKGNCIIEIPAGRISRHQVFELYKHSHIGVYPAKAEGWNLPLIESIASGLPCIATDYSAHTEYLTEDMGYNQDLLIKNFSLAEARDGVHFHGDRGNWAMIGADKIAEKMVYSFNNYKNIIEKFNNSKIKNTFTWENSASKLLSVINEIR